MFVVAIRNRLINQCPITNEYAVIASGGWDEMRFHEPVRPGDTLTLHYQWLTKRESESKPDRGIMTGRFWLTNQHDVTVMSHLETGVIQRRPPGTG